MNFPAGIESGFEIYLHGPNARVLIDGRRYEYAALPAQTRAIFFLEMIKDKRVVESLHLMGCDSDESMEFKYVGCRYGAINGTSDLNGITTTPDAPICECMGNCPGFGVVCRIPEKLTKKEYQVARYIGKGNLDKEICSILEIEYTTCRTYINRIREKLGFNNRVEIALWAQNIGIV